MSDALPALHAISGCDFTSAFYEIGKQKMYKIAKSYDHFKEVLSKIGNRVSFDLHLFAVLQEMIAECCGVKVCNSINGARYTVRKLKYLTHNNFHQLKTNCFSTASVAKIWKSAFLADANLLHPAEGWCEVNGLQEIKWMSQ